MAFEQVKKWKPVMNMVKFKFSVKIKAKLIFMYKVW